MTLEEFLKDKANKKAYDDAVAAAIDEAKQPLVAKNKELLGEVKALKTEKAELETEVEELNETVSSKDKVGSEKWEKEKAKLEAKHNKEKTELATENEKLKSTVKKQLVDGGLKDQLLKANINPDDLPFVESFIKSNNTIEITDENGEQIAKVGDKKLSDFVSTWAASDTAKRFIKAPNNSGGGSNGSNTNGGVSQEDVAKMSPIEKINYARANPGK